MRIKKADLINQVAALARVCPTTLVSVNKQRLLVARDRILAVVDTVTTAVPPCGRTGSPPPAVTLYKYGVRFIATFYHDGSARSATPVLHSIEQMC